MTPAFNPSGLDYNGFDHPKTESQLTFDEKNGVVIWFGGCSMGYTNSTWLYSVTDNTWTKANGLTYIQNGEEKEGPFNWNEKDCNTLPYGQCHYDITYDTDLGQCIKHAGINSGWTGADGNTWTYDASDGVWTKYYTITGGSVSYGNYAIAFDRDNHRTILFGCLNTGYGGGDHNTCAFNSTSGTWTRMNPSGPPPSRGWACMEYHQLLKKTVVFGGATYTGTPKNDTWLYDYTTNTWEQVFPQNPPSGRTRAATAYDSKNNVIIMFGGNTGSYGGSGGGTLNDTWILDLANNRWIEIQPSSHPESAKTWSGAYDPVNNVMVVIGSSSETWVYRYKNGTAVNVKKNPGKAHLELNIVPNPFRNTARIFLSSKFIPRLRSGFQGSKFKVQIFSIKGKMVKDFSSSLYPLPFTLYLQAAGLSPGVYLVRAVVGSKIYSKKVMIIR